MSSTFQITTEYIKMGITEDKMVLIFANFVLDQNLIQLLIFVPCNTHSVETNYKDRILLTFPKSIHRCVVAATLNLISSQTFTALIIL
jgi:hypothetical protein